MAIVDGDRDEIVIRILYDGPALAGKTTSIKALLSMLAVRRRSEIFTPGEAEGRTLYFDWMDYLGGWCDGQQVRCQIVSAPGQRSLAKRRKLLMRDADVVVFVAESTAEGVDAAVGFYAGLKECISRTDEPPVPVVIQANKQDLPAALDVDELRERFADERHIAIIGSAASDGIGVREAFTFAVRLALDRVRELAKDGKLRVGQPSIGSGEELLSWIEREESAEAAQARVPPDSPQLPATASRQATEAPSPADRAEPTHPGGRSTEPSVSPQPEHRLPAERGHEREPPVAAAPEVEAPPGLPTSSAPSGLVWRPMEGRIILHELEGAISEPRRDDDGSWIAVAAGRWHLASEARHAYADLEEGRRRLLEAARLHNTLAPVLSERRALTLAETHDGRWRLWKIVRKEVSLGDRLTAVVAQLDGEAAGKLFGIAEALLRATDRFRELGAPFRATLNTVGECDGRLCFLGFVPDAAETRAATPTPEALIRDAFGCHLEQGSRDQTIDAPSALAQLRRIQKDRPERSGVVEALAAMLIGR